MDWLVSFPGFRSQGPAFVETVVVDEGIHWVTACEARDGGGRRLRVWQKVVHGYHPHPKAFEHRVERACLEDGP